MSFRELSTHIFGPDNKPLCGKYPGQKAGIGEIKSIIIEKIGNRHVCKRCLIVYRAKFANELRSRLKKSKISVIK